MDRALTLFIEHANEKDSLKRAIIRKRVTAVMYGHVSEKDPTNEHLRYNYQRTDLFHLYSAKNLGYTYGVRKYSKFLGLKDYIDMPIDFIDDLLEGYGRGTEDLIKSEAAAAKEAARLAGQKQTEGERTAMKMANKG